MPRIFLAPKRVATEVSGAVATSVRDAARREGISQNEFFRRALNAALTVHAEEAFQGGLDRINSALLKQANRIDNLYAIAKAVEQAAVEREDVRDAKFAEIRKNRDAQVDRNLETVSAQIEEVKLLVFQNHKWLRTNRTQVSALLLSGGEDVRRNFSLALENEEKLSSLLNQFLKG